MPSTSPEKRFFGHPFQLSSIFHIELWERFSFYGMQSILLIYLYYAVKDGGLGIDQGLAGGIVGAYSAFIYLSAILGGWIADRVLGAERTLFYSGWVVMLGHIMLALLPGLQGLVVGLVLTALGSGGVKSSASAMVGSLYERDDLRPLRDAGFSIFYISVNIGGFFGPLLTGLLQTNMGFHYGFGLAALGMAGGLLWYSRGRKILPRMAPVNPLHGRQLTVAALVGLAGVIVILMAVIFGWINAHNYSNIFLWAGIIVLVGYFSRFLLGSACSRTEKRHIAAYLPLFLVSCAFWALWEQVFTSVTIYFDETVDRVYGSFTVPVAWASSAQSFWVILLSGVLAALWTKMGPRQPRTPMKFSLSLLVLALAYYSFVPFLQHETAMPLPVYMGLPLLLVTISELLLSPVALSFSTKIAPASCKAQMVALNFLAISLGSVVGGQLFELGYHKESAADFYLLLVTIAVVGAVALLLLVPLLNRMLHDVE
ncbi:MAG: oligopeptide:H+ symporter [Lautropia sp.]|nr:oligopeptide:H+ symporter [Lautropia sp.]